MSDPSQHTEMSLASKNEVDIVDIDCQIEISVSLYPVKQQKHSSLWSEFLDLFPICSQT